MQALGMTSRSTSSPLLADSWKGKAEFPSSEPTPNQDGGLAAEPTRGEDASCTARCRFERDARGSRWDVLESGEKEECVWFTRRYRFLVGWYFPTRLITRSEFTMLARIDFSSRG